MGVITISRELGSLGDAIAEECARKLNYRLLTKNEFEKQKEKYSVIGCNFEKFDEKSPSIWETFKGEKSKYLDFLETVILKEARGDNVIIVGRGGASLLRKCDSVFSVRIIAGWDERVRNCMKKLDCSHSDAEKILHRSDKDRHGFHQFFFDIQWNNPKWYDMVINSEKISIENAAEVIIHGKKQIGKRSDSEDISGILDNMYKAQQVRNAILYRESIPVDILEVKVHENTAYLQGIVAIQSHIEECHKAAKSIKGIEKVDSEIFFMNSMIGL